jgi:hypothetical protein
VLLHLVPAKGTTPHVDVRVCQPDGGRCTRTQPGLAGMSDAKYDFLVYDTDDTKVVTLQHFVKFDDNNSYCRQIDVTLSHGHTLELTVEPDQCGLTLSPGCANCAAPIPCMCQPGDPVCGIVTACH